MKKFTIIAILLLTFFSATDAQLIKSYGLKVGMASTNQDWNFSSSTGVIVNASARQSVDAGIFIEWLNLPIISIITEADYVQKGADCTTNIIVTTPDNPDGTGENLIFSTKVAYLSVPVLAKIKLAGALVSPYILAGPRFDFYLTNNSDGMGKTLNGSQKMDFGGTFGLGIEISSLLPIQLGAEIRYSPTFQDSYSISYLTVRNRSLEFLLVASF
jgi:hypothetical protein